MIMSMIVSLFEARRESVPRLNDKLLLAPRANELLNGFVRCQTRVKPPDGFENDPRTVPIFPFLLLLFLLNVVGNSRASSPVPLSPPPTNHGLTGAAGSLTNTSSRNASINATGRGSAVQLAAKVKMCKFLNWELGGAISDTS